MNNNEIDASELQQLEQEIRENCGEDFLGSLKQYVTEERKKARNKRRSQITTTIIGSLITAYVIIVSPAVLDAKSNKGINIFHLLINPFEYYPILPVIILCYIFVLLISVPLLWALIPVGKSKRYNSDSMWVYYINDVPDASPRAWICHGLDNDTWLPGGSEARRCLWSDGLKGFGYDTQKFIKSWIHDDDNPVSYEEVYKRLSYYYRYIENENKTIPPSIAIPKTIEPSWLENDDSIDFPELDDFVGHVMQHKDKQLTLEMKTFGLEIGTVSPRGRENERSYTLKIIESESGNRFSSKKLDEAEAKKLVRNILFCFFEKPWLSTPVTKELPWKTKNGGIVGLRLIYTPDKTIRVEHIRDLENSTINLTEITLNDASKLPPGCHSDKYNGFSYEYDYCPTEHYGKPYLSLTFPLRFRNRKLDSGVLTSEAKHQFYKIPSLSFHHRKQPLNGMRIITHKLSQTLFSFTSFTCNSPEFFSHCEIESHFKNKSLVKWFLDDLSRRNSINALFEAGYCEVNISHGEVTLHIEGDKAQDINANDLLSKTVPRLSIFNDQLIEKFLEFYQQQEKSEKVRKTINTVVPILLIALVFLFRPDKYNLTSATFILVLYSVPIWLPIYIALINWTWWTTQFLKKKNRSACNISAWFFGLPAIISIAIGMISYANTTWDSNPPTEKTVAIIKKISSDNSHKLILEHWDSSQDKIHLTVSGTIYNKITPDKDKLLLQIKPGYLGFPWIENHELITSQP